MGIPSTRGLRLLSRSEMATYVSPNGSIPGCHWSALWQADRRETISSECSRIGILALHLLLRQIQDYPGQQPHHGKHAVVRLPPQRATQIPPTARELLVTIESARWATSAASPSAPEHLEQHDQTMPKGQVLPVLWWSRHPGMPAMAEIQELSGGHGSKTISFSHAGPGQQRRQLRTGECPLGNTCREQ